MRRRATVLALLGFGLLAAFSTVSLLAKEPVEGCIAVTNMASQRLLIVTPEQFEKDLAPFVEHKRKELPVELATLEAVLAKSQGVDDPEKLKQFLYQAWRKRHVHYVLLVGDADVMPVRYMVQDRKKKVAQNCAFYPSDLYYADVARKDGSFDDWNARKDGFHAGYFGEVRGEKNKDDPINFDQIDYRPELALGRWPVNTSEEVQAVVAKTIRFEQRIAAQPSAERRAALVCTGGWIDCRSLMDGVAKSLPKDWTCEKRYYSDANHPWKTPPPSPDQVQDLLNSGVDLMLHAGHGTSISWNDSFTLRQLRQLTNADHLPVIMSAGCSTGRFVALPPYEPYVDVSGVKHKGTSAGEVFDAPPPPPAVYQKGRCNPVGLGERFVRRGPNGAVAYIGCSTGSQPCGLTLLKGFAKTWGQSHSARLGDCWMGAVSYYYDQQLLATIKPDRTWYPPSIFFQAMKFMFYGDPSLRLPH
jgi:hypothetical protein